ncbi:hypothetical protein [Blautia sp. An81]|uniref:hypothetical protein n=1 Tax=Blautia sp. An81 TaxID=1965659 RepID=UPI000B3AB004|nr:hypothetical protein [Blautia sp. An81]OUN31534.1 hypothetical protein B5G33_02245 [Blautia sp. An81]
MYKTYQSLNCKTIITKGTGKYKAKVRKMNIIYQGSKTKLRNVFVREKKNKQEFLKKTPENSAISMIKMLYYCLTV